MSILDSLRPKGDAVEIPLVYVRDAVVFPHTIAPVLAATKFCIVASEVASKADKQIFISLLKNLPPDGANDIDVQEIGTVSHVLQSIKLADGSVRLLVEGQRRARLRRTVFRKEYLGAIVDLLADDDEMRPDDKEFSALVQIVRRDFSNYAELVKKIPNEVLHAVQRAEDPHKLCDTVTNAMGLKTERKQDLLSVIPVRERLEATAQALSQDIELLTIQKRISQKVRARMDKTQKDYFLQEQLKEINKELGREDDENATIPLPVRPLTEKVGIYLNRFRVKHGMTEYRSPQTPDTLPLGV